MAGVASSSVPPPPSIVPTTTSTVAASTSSTLLSSSSSVLLDSTVVTTIQPIAGGTGQVPLEPSTLPQIFKKFIPVQSSFSVIPTDAHSKGKGPAPLSSLASISSSISSQTPATASGSTSSSTAPSMEPGRFIPEWNVSTTDHDIWFHHVA
ncbi:hypothetical protein NE237_013113 [Protea cynaroides]|uniref:Uncharacterized protein n=1 Tax=Protea cynaroides TaxID=273540 RepID=A0A9Q0JZH6_9MAGN|nr:hypothetical protein NE237_013113 [Protea cynaroides]